MKTLISFAQKGLILNKTLSKILVIKYSYSLHAPEKINGKFGLPGGQLEFGEDPDDSFRREVEEETGLEITPSLPFYIWSWTYQKEDVSKQIVAIARLAFYKNGKVLNRSKEENESKIQEVKWLELEQLNLKDFVYDEVPAIEKFLKYSKKNPFAFF